MREVWKSIEGYEDHYQVSNLGRIKSLYFKNRHGVVYREKILKAGFNGKYYQITLSNNGKTKMYQVHRLVAMAFVKNDNDYKIVNHVNCDKTDNRAINLEWCNQSHNIKEAYRLGQIKIYKGENSPYYNKPSKKRKKIMQLDKENNLIKIWECADLIEKELKINASNIRGCCNNKRKTAGGYIWKYTN